MQVRAVLEVVIPIADESPVGLWAWLNGHKVLLVLSWTYLLFLINLRRLNISGPYFSLRRRLDINLLCITHLLDGRRVYRNLQISDVGCILLVNLVLKACMSSAWFQGNDSREFKLVNSLIDLAPDIVSYLHLGVVVSKLQELVMEVGVVLHLVKLQLLLFDLLA